MPARKPFHLHTRHATKAEKDARVAAEDAMTPARGLPMGAPSRLKDHLVASEAWRRLMRVYAEIDGAIVTRLDQDLLIDYCMLIEQLAELDLMRRTTYRMWLEIGAAHDQAVKKAKEAADAAEAARQAANESGAEMPENGIGSLAYVEKWESKAVALAVKGLDAYEAVLKLDARADQKRKSLHQLRMSLYLTPRSRAGVAPSTKEPEPEPDPFEQMINQQIIDDVNGFVNGHDGP